MTNSGHVVFVSDNIGKLTLALAGIGNIGFYPRAVGCVAVTADGNVGNQPVAVVALAIAVVGILGIHPVAVGTGAVAVVGDVDRQPVTRSVGAVAGDAVAVTGVVGIQPVGSVGGAYAAAVIGGERNNQPGAAGAVTVAVGGHIRGDGGPSTLIRRRMGYGTGQNPVATDRIHRAGIHRRRIIRAQRNARRRTP